jgi:hypothetical protein
MLKCLSLLIFLSAPNVSMACFSCCHTFDLADPGAWGLKDPLSYKYILGRVTKVETGKQLDHSPAALVTIEVLKDYSYPPGASQIEVLTYNGSCFRPPKIGFLAKFGIDYRGDTPRLAIANWNF